MLDTIEIKEIFNIGTLNGIRIIPDKRMGNGYKRISGDNIFVSEMNYKDLKGMSPKAIIKSLDFLKTMEIDLTNPKGLTV